MKSQQTRKGMSIRTKLMIPILSLTIVFFVVLGAVMNACIQDSLITAGRNAATSLGELILEDISLDDIKNVMQEMKRNDAYWRIYHTLRKVEKKTDIEWAYLTFKKGDEYLYLVVTTDTETTAFEHILDRYLDYTKNALSIPYYYSPVLEISEFGTLINATVPIYDEDGSILAALEIDYNGTKVLTTSARIRILISVMCVILCLILSSVIIHAFDKLLGRLNLVGDKLGELSSNNGNLTKRIEIKSNDEIGRITQELNDMLDFFRDIVLCISNSSDQLKETMDILDTSTLESTEGISNVASIMKEMSSMMHQTKTSMEQINSSVTGIKLFIHEIYQLITSGQAEMNTISQQADKILRHIDVKANDAKCSMIDLVQTMTTRLEQFKLLTQIEDFCKSISTTTADNLCQRAQAFSSTMITSIKELETICNHIAELTCENTFDSYDELLKVGNHYYNSSTCMKNKFDILTVKINSLEDAIIQIEEAISGVNTATEENFKSILDVANTTNDLSDIMYGNKIVVEETRQLSAELEIEINKFIYQ